MSANSPARDLWGDLTPSNHPLHTNTFADTLLSEQAALLSEKTQGELLASVELKNLERGRAWRFFITAPYLDYRYELFRVEQGFSRPFPLTVFDFNAQNPVQIADNELVFETYIRDILSGQATRAVIASLLQEIQQRRQEDSEQG